MFNLAWKTLDSLLQEYSQASDERRAQISNILDPKNLNSFSEENAKILTEQDLLSLEQDWLSQAREHIPNGTEEEIEKMAHKLQTSAMLNIPLHRHILIQLYKIRPFQETFFVYESLSLETRAYSYYNDFQRAHEVLSDIDHETNYHNEVLQRVKPFFRESYLFSFVKESNDKNKYVGPQEHQEDYRVISFKSRQFSATSDFRSIEQIIRFTLDGRGFVRQVSASYVVILLNGADYHINIKDPPLNFLWLILGSLRFRSTNFLGLTDPRSYFFCKQSGISFTPIDPFSWDEKDHRFPNWALRVEYEILLDLFGASVSNVFNEPGNLILLRFYPIKAIDAALRKAQSNTEEEKEWPFTPGLVPLYGSNKLKDNEAPSIVNRRLFFGLLTPSASSAS